jgi:hypothetical protein
MRTERRHSDTRSDEQAGGQAGRRAGGQAGRRAGGQAGRRAGGQAGRQAGRQAGTYKGKNYYEYVSSKSERKINAIHLSSVRHFRLSEIHCVFLHCRH